VREGEKKGLLMVIGELLFVIDRPANEVSRSIDNK
jgi:hypothetical protein